MDIPACAEDMMLNLAYQKMWHGTKSVYQACYCTCACTGFETLDKRNNAKVFATCQ